MNVKTLFYAVAFLSLSWASFTYAQDVLPEYTQARRFAPSNAEQLLFSYTLTPNYFNNSDKFWYEYKTSEGTNWYLVDPDSRNKRLLFDRDELAAQISEIVREPFTGQQLPIEDLRLKEDDRTFTFSIKGTNGNYFFSYDYPSSRLTRITKNEIPAKIRWANISPDKKRVVFAKDLNLYVMSYEDYEKAVKNPEDKTISEIALTTDGEKDFGFGMPRTFLNTDTLCDHKRKYVMGNWSPDGRYFVATLSDQREVQDLWVINSIAKPRPTLETYKYQMPGEAGSPIVHLYLFDLENAGKRKEIRVDCFKDQIINLASKPDKERTGLTRNSIWLGDNQTFYLTRVSRDMKRVDICSYTIGEDSVKAIIEERLNTSMESSGLKLITPGDYFHLVSMDKSMRYIVDNYSRVNTIPATALYDNQGNRLMTLEESDFSQLFMAGYKFPEPFSVKAADGVTDLYGVMYKPFDFDSTKVYPVINYVYPGPQQEGTFFRYIPMNPRTDRLAQAGFVVVCMGHRGGHPSRSKWYHNYGYGNLRDYPMADHKVAIEQLCARYKFMDINRVGIHGHSGGGFMSTAAMLLYPDFFKVAVSCAGNHDNNIYNRWWGEKHHGVKEITDDMGNISFDIRIPTNQELARNLKGHLLLIHGDIDNNVHPANTIVVVDELIKAGKRFDMLIVPGKRHHFDDYNEYYYWRMVDYFSEYLRGERETGADIKDLKLGNWFQGYQ